ncbi:MAG: ribosome biogenesis GTPase Der [Anaerolineales bacterium]
MPRPIVALVGRPNVGKSTLFNRLAGERLAVVHEQPGTTRDRLVTESEWNGVQFDLVDTGGFDPSAGDELDAQYLPQIRSQAEQAILDADAVLFLVDGITGVSPVDHEIADILRREQIPILLVVNKIDSPGRGDRVSEFYELGLGDPIPISALHGRGTGDMLDRLTELMDAEPETGAEDSGINIAIVGRPNVGKSSLLNRLLGEERVIVSPHPGTTRDAIDTQMTFEDEPITLIDTAGIRRRGRIKPGVEKYSALRALKAIERADVSLLMIDGTEGVTAQDAHIAGMILDKLKSVLLLVNKWDIVPDEIRDRQMYGDHIRAALKFLDFVPVLFISALKGDRVNRVLPMALLIQEERLNRIPTARLNELLLDAQATHAPPSKAGTRLRIYFASQVRTDPPTFLFHVNDPELMHFSYARFLENRIREEYKYVGTPIRLSFRERS